MQNPRSIPTLLFVLFVALAFANPTISHAGEVASWDADSELIIDSNGTVVSWENRTSFSKLVPAGAAPVSNASTQTPAGFPGVEFSRTASTTNHLEAPSPLRASTSFAAAITFRPGTDQTGAMTLLSSTGDFTHEGSPQTFDWSLQYEDDEVALTVQGNTVTVTLADMEDEWWTAVIIFDFIESDTSGLGIRLYDEDGETVAAFSESSGPFVFLNDEDFTSTLTVGHGEVDGTSARIGAIKLFDNVPWPSDAEIDKFARVFAVGSTSPIAPQTFVVSTSANSGPGSLPQAISDAAASPGRSIITFNAALNGQSLTLTGTQIEIEDDTGPVEIDASALPDGFGIDGNERSRVMQIFEPSFVTFRNIEIVGGRINSPGGGIRAFRSDISLIDSTINDCATLPWTSTGSSLDGGGISIGSGTLRLKNTTLSANFTSDGGDNNSNNGGWGGRGGAIYILNGTLSMHECRIVNNHTGSGGSSGSGATSNGLGGNGGGIFAHNTNIWATQAIIRNNSTGSGGAAAATSGFVINGASGGSGGGVYITTSTGTLAQFSDCEISTNRTGSGAAPPGNHDSRGGSGGVGGGINLSGGTLLLERTCINSNTTGDGADGSNNGPGGSGGRGGGVAATAADIIMSECSIRNCRTGSGGTSGSLVGSGGIGGGMGLYFCSVSIRNSLISGNITGAGIVLDRNGHGGGIAISGDATPPISPTSLELIGVTITGNDAGEGLGGGIYMSPADAFSANLSNLTIVDNKARAGGGVRIQTSTFSPEIEVRNSIISQNVALSGTDIDGTVTGGLGTNFNGGDPQLLPLGDFGGPTLTMMPLIGSPVIGASTEASLPLDLHDLDGDGDTTEVIPFDQRGEGHPRISNAAPDLGAVEQNSNDRLQLPRLFIPNPATSPNETDVTVFDPAAAGTFSGILVDEAGNPIGSFTAKLNSSGRLSGSVFFNDLGVTDRFKTTFVELDGSFAPITLKKSGYELALSLTTTSGGENKFRIGGDLSATGEPDRLISADLSGFHKKTNPAPFADSYTALLPANPLIGNTPQGDGYALVTVGTDGKIRCVGALGDGTKLSVSGFVSEDREWRFFKTLYRTKPKGSIGGVVSFNPVSGISDFNGSLSWHKEADSREKLYPAGFTIADQPIIGSLYKIPYPGEAILSPIVVGMQNNATWQIGLSNLTDPISKDLTWNGKNKVAAEGLETGQSLKVSATSKTGLVRGTYRDKTTGLKVAFAGVAFQAQDLIAGHFPAATDSGFFLIRPAGLAELTVFDDTGTEIDQGDTVARGDVGRDGGIDNSRFKITNQGSGNLQIHSIESDTPDVFGVINGGPALLAPGESAYFWTRFVPPSEDTFTATLSISSDAGNLSFDVTGNGVSGSANGTSSDDYDSWSGTSPATSPVATATTRDFHYDPSAHGGTYTGYSYRGELPHHPITGLITLKASTKNASVSGTVIVAGAKESFRGPIDVAGQFYGQTNKGTAIFFETSRVANGADGKKLVGTLGNGDIFELTHHAFHKNLKPATNLENSYTMLLPSSDERGANAPQGDGYGAVKIGLDGKIRASLVLGDGTKVTQTSFVSIDGEWLFYRDLYRTKPKGFLAGRLFFRDVAGVSDFDGELQWLKHEHSKEKRFNRGFNLRQVALGSVYTAPASAERAFSELDASSGNFLIGFADGDVALLPAHLTGEWDSKNRVRYSRTDREKLSIKVNAKTGTITGSYTDPVEKIKVPFGGAIFSKQGILNGHFIGTDQTGVIDISAAIGG